MRLAAQELLSILSADTQPLPPAQPNDWRARHPGEAEQSFAAISKPRNRGIHANSSLSLYATPEIESDFPAAITLLAPFLTAYFQISTSGWSTIPLDVEAHDRRNGQTRIRALLRELPPKTHGQKRLVLTSYDLFPDEADYNFVFGEADYSDSKAVVSLFRYGIPPRVPLTGVSLIRLLKVTSHEIGHLFALAHCVAGLCNMNGVNHTEELDSHPLDLCPECLAKWAWFADSDVSQRLRDLHSFYERHSLHAERETTACRMALLNATGNA